MPITLPAYVAPNELIQSAWGNSVVDALDEIDDEFVEKGGDTMTGPLYINGSIVRPGTTNGSQVQLIDLDGGHSAYLSYFGSASDISTIGTRTGLIGFVGTSTLEVRNEVAAGDMIIETPGDLRLVPGGAEVARVDASGFIFVGKTTTDIAATGVELPATGRVFATVSADLANVALNKEGAAVVSGATYVVFDLAGSLIGSITRNAATSAVLYNTTSDSRLKTDVGLKGDDGLDTVMQVAVHRFQRDGGRGSESLGVFAQELVDVIPQAVTVGGEDVNAEPWMVAYSNESLIGHLLLSVQQLAERVAELEAAA